MEIKSDKENKQNPSAFTRVWNFIASDIWKTIMLIIFPIVIYTWYIAFPEDYLWLMLSAAGGVFGIGLLTNGELFKDLKAMLFIFFIIFIAVTGVWYGTTAQKTETATLDLKPFIIDIKANEDKNAFVINNKLPFESGIEITFSGVHQYDALFVDKKHFDEFNIIAEKSCSIYRIKSISCETKIRITHKDRGEDLVVKTLYNSVYPKKLVIEDEEK